MEHENNLSTEFPNTETESKPIKSVHPQWIMIGLALLISGSSLFVYWKTSHPRSLDTIEIPPLMVEESPHQSAGSLDVLAERLKQKLERNPENGEGWALLARSYVEMDRHAEAVPAFEHAINLIPKDAQLLADYADALGVVNGGKLNNPSVQLIHQALDLDAENVKARLLAATVAFDEKQYDKAISVWESLITEPSLDSEVRKEIAANISDARRLLRVTPRSLSTFIPEQIGFDRKAISGIVHVAPQIARKSLPTDTLFVFAKAAHGPAMPLAAVRAQGSTFPYAFHLDDSNTMIPGTSLSHSDEVVIVARLSRSGDATATKGDFEGKSQPVRAGEESVQITIDTEIQ